MDIKEINAWRNGFISALDLKQNSKCSIFGMDAEQVIDILFKHKESETMAKNLKYEWCRPYAKCNKEFLGWIYDRLQAKGDSYSDSHIKRLDEIINTMPGAIPDGPPITIDITDSKPVTIMRHGKVIYSDG